MEKLLKKLESFKAILSRLADDRKRIDAKEASIKARLDAIVAAIDALKAKEKAA